MNFKDFQVKKKGGGYNQKIPTKQNLKWLANEVDYSLLDVGWN